jgi:saccharopepsin
MSATDPLSAWESFVISRAATLRFLPPDLFEVPGLLEQLLAESGNQTPTETPPATKAAGALSDNVSGSDGSNAQLLSLIEKYGPVVIGLLAGNVAIGLLLFAVAVISVLRRPNVKSRTINPSYTPVRFKEAEPAEARYHDHDE